MPSLSDHPDRHVVIDRREGHYLAFPDVIRARDGRLIVIYNEADKHVRPTRRVLVVKISEDNGHTWSRIIYPDSPRSHSPRLHRFGNASLLISDSSRIFHTSRNNGDTWNPFPATGLTHDMHDRIMNLGNNVWLTTGHKHVGQEEHPAIRQPPTEQIVFRSADQGHTWEQISVLAAHRNLVLCEASMTRLPDGRILALMRENSFVFEPMYLCISEDDGASWSDPVPTPLMGHRPTMGQISDGRLLVTYRNVGPDWGTCAWLGTADELMSGFRVHGRAVDPANPIFTPEGMHVSNEAGKLSVVRYALRPMTDPRTATARLEAEIRVDAADKNGCGLRLGTWWRLYPDRMVPDVEDGQPVPLPPGRFNTIRLEYAAGKVMLHVNNELCTEINVPADHAETRPVMFGAPYPFEDNMADCTWRRVSLNIIEPAYRREYAWNWNAGDGLPDQWVQDHILELRNARHAAAPDFGYSGWTELDDGKFFCAYHHGDALAADYEALLSAFVAGTWFTLDDFRQG
ncbi:MULTISPECIES: sialidase family protein [unclassified Pseudodesulfovibrio]|uniref:sialidase family protein n=1 Tax=unclassified Pseudodesulfovibrio TaxID=2661612 RepID=UPI000FEB6411|nr:MULTISPECIES: sialidase family protein [unclassified Pseudodesulfovibrio]MCJ2164601.1 glycoside hydrolase [Pseudodesulfovibrio sp. S3-i]RWU04205.1 exo-alpha-sialidase [Pseudodesulfovibrio sp. S3]